MQEPNPSAKTPSGWRRSKLVAGTLALTLAALGTGLATTAAPAFANIPSTNDYTIGTPSGAVTGVTATPATVVAGTAGQGFQVKFTATTALASTNTITIGDSDSNAVVGDTTLTTVEVLNDTLTGDCIQPGGGAISGGELVVTLGASCSIPAGDVGEVDFQSLVPAVNFTFNVSAPSGATPATSNTITVNTVPPTWSAAVTTNNTNTTYAITGVGQETGIHSWSALTAAATTLTLTAADGGVLADEVDWYSGTAGYTVTYTPSGGVATADTINSTSPGATANIVGLNLATGIPANATTTIEATGLTPTTAGSSDTLTIEPATAAVPYAGSTETASNAVVFGGSVSDVTVAASPSLASASSTYTVTFKTATAITANTGTITVSEPNTTLTGVTSVLVKDTTDGAYCVVTPTHPFTYSLTATLATASGCANVGSTGGDVITLQFTGATNPATVGTYSDFTVVTSNDTVPVDAAAYSIGLSSATGVGVSVSPATPGALATYVITNVIATTAITAGTELTITAAGPAAGTVFPAAASDISVKDNTTASGSGTVSDVIAGGGATLSFEFPEAIVAGDNLTLTILDVANPTTASSIDTLSLTGAVNAPAVAAPAFPDAITSYPSGGIVDFAGTYYVFAGGHAFGFPTVPTLQAVQLIDDAEVQTAATGAVVPTTAPIEGTTIIVYNNPTIYVVAANGQLNGFATEAQFLGDGYDPADVITVPNFGGLTVGSTAGSVGAPDNALALAGNGAIVDSSGTFYVAAGGHGFGIPTPAVLAAVQAGDSATPLVGTVPAAWSTAPILNGTIVTLSGTVFVAYGGSLFGIKSEAQLAADGFGGTPSIVIPNAGGLALVDVYTGA